MEESELDFSFIAEFYEMIDKNSNLQGYAAIVMKKLFCNDCNDVRLLILIDKTGKISKIKSLNIIEAEGKPVNHVTFFNQFVGCEYIKIKEHNYPINNITGATKTATGAIELIEKATKIIKNIYFQNDNKNL